MSSKEDSPEKEIFLKTGSSPGRPLYFPLSPQTEEKRLELKLIHATVMAGQTFGKEDLENTDLGKYSDAFLAEIRRLASGENIKLPSKLAEFSDKDRSNAMLLASQIKIVQKYKQWQKDQDDKAEKLCRDVENLRVENEQWRQKTGRYHPRDLPDRKHRKPPVTAGPDPFEDSRHSLFAHLGPGEELGATGGEPLPPEEQSDFERDDYEQRHERGRSPDRSRDKSGDRRRERSKDRNRGRTGRNRSRDGSRERSRERSRDRYRGGQGYGRYADIKFKIPQPHFHGNIEAENAAEFLENAQDWMALHNIDDPLYYWHFMLKGGARIWWPSVAPQCRTWADARAAFTRKYVVQGKTPAYLVSKWMDLRFDYEKDEWTKWWANWEHQAGLAKATDDTKKYKLLEAVGLDYLYVEFEHYTYNRLVTIVEARVLHKKQQMSSKGKSGNPFTALYHSHAGAQQAQADLQEVRLRALEQGFRNQTFPQTCLPLVAEQSGPPDPPPVDAQTQTNGTGQHRQVPIPPPAVPPVPAAPVVPQPVTAQYDQQRWRPIQEGSPAHWRQQVSQPPMGMVPVFPYSHAYAQGFHSNAAYDRAAQLNVPYPTYTQPPPIRGGGRGGARGRGRGRGNPTRAPGRCWGCGQIGHLQRNCPSSLNQANRQVVQETQGSHPGGPPAGGPGGNRGNNGQGRGRSQGSSRPPPGQGQVPQQASNSMMIPPLMNVTVPDQYYEDTSEYLWHPTEQGMQNPYVPMEVSYSMQALNA